MKHTLIRCLALTTLLTPGLLQALGLGEPQVRSHLGQPLRIEIPLVPDDGLAPEEVRISLAGADDHAALGIDYPSLARELRINVVARPSGLTVLLQTRIPVHEPYLDVLLSVRTPKSKLLRNITLLLDPVEHQAALPVAVSQQPPAQPRPRKPPAVETRTTDSSTPPPATRAETPPAGPSSGYQVKPGDSLWLIARKHAQGTSQSPQALMQAIYEANPHAFVGGSIDRLRAGSKLAIPGSSEPPPASAASGPSEPALTLTDKLPRAQDTVRSQEMEQLQQQVEQLSASNAEYRQRIAEAQVQLDGMVQRYKDMSARMEKLLASSSSPAAAPAPSAKEAPAPGSGDAEAGSALSLLWLLVLIPLAAALYWLYRNRERFPIGGRQVPAQDNKLPGPLHVHAANAASTTRGQQTGTVIISSLPDAQPEDIPTVDPIVAASAYLAYGDTHRAEQILEEAIQEDPRSSQLKLKMLEVYASRGDEASFDHLATLLTQQSPERYTAEIVDLYDLLKANQRAPRQKAT